MGFSLAGSGNGVIGIKSNNILGGAGVRGQNISTVGPAYGVYGTSSGGGITSYGGYFESTAANGNGLYAVGSAGTVPWAIWGEDLIQSPGNSYAGAFTGDVDITGTMTAGTKAFKIDHPL